MINYKKIPTDEYQKWFQSISFKTEPFHHQYASLAFTFGEHLHRVILFQGIGLGKTLTSLYLLKCWDANKKILVVCPNSVSSTWIDEIQKHTDFKYYLLKGSTDKRIKLAKSDNPGIYIINYEGLKLIGARKRMKGYASIPGIGMKYGFEALVIDESHHIKAFSLQTVISREFSKIARYVILMTGTPISSSVIDLFYQFWVLNPTVFGDDFNEFLYRYFWKENKWDDWHPKRICRICGKLYTNKYRHIQYHNISVNEYINKYQNEKTSEDIILTKANQHGIGFSRNECFDLPEKVYEIRQVFPTEEQLSLTRKIIDGIPIAELNDSNIEYHTMKILQIANGFLINSNKSIYELPENPKAKELLELLPEMNSKFIIYHTYIHESSIISKLLEKSKIRYTILNGQVKDKSIPINEFLNTNCRCLVANYKTGGEGLNLQIANTIIFYDCGYIGTILRQQCEGRIHRVGQIQTCVIIDIVMRQSIDEILYKGLMSKSIVVQEVMKYLQNFIQNLPKNHKNS